MDKLPNLEMPNIQNNKILDVGIIVSDKNDTPSIMLRRIISDPDIIKIVLIAAITEQPITIYPSFKRKIQALSTLCEKGILYYKDGQYSWVI